MQAQTLNDWDDSPCPLMGCMAAPVAGVALCLMALWIAALPQPTHSVAVHLRGAWLAPCRSEPAIHTVVISPGAAWSWDGQALAGQADLDARLKAVGALPGAGQGVVQVQPLDGVTYGQVVAVMAAAQRLGVRSWGVAGAHPFVSDERCSPIEI